MSKEVLAYKESYDRSIKSATICLLVKDGYVLLAMKKRGFGAGKWNGVGGKQNESEKIEDTAIRETQEEIDVTPIKLQKTAIINFFFPEKPEFDQRVHVYLVSDWQGTPSESEEMAPQWFSVDSIPYDQMWEDDTLWLPLVLEQKFVEADFLFTADEKLYDQSIVSSPIEG